MVLFLQTVAGDFVGQPTVASSSVKRLQQGVSIASPPVRTYETALSNGLSSFSLGSLEDSCEFCESLELSKLLFKRFGPRGEAIFSSSISSSLSNCSSLGKPNSISAIGPFS